MRDHGPLDDERPGSTDLEGNEPFNPREGAMKQAGMRPHRFAPAAIAMVAVLTTNGGGGGAASTPAAERRAPGGDAPRPPRPGKKKGLGAFGVVLEGHRKAG